MSHQARVYLQRPLEKTTTYIGLTDVDPRPVRGHQIRFMHDGKLEIGLVDQVAPDKWERLGVVPTIHIVQIAGE
jgi:hypothetical protein